MRELLVGSKRSFRKLVAMLLFMAMSVGLVSNVSLKAELAYAEAEDMAVEDEPDISVDIAEIADDTASNYAYVGDVDGDGEVTAKDVTKLRRHLAGGWGVDVETEDADIDEDGEVTSKDVTKLRRFLAGGWGVELPEKKPSIIVPNIDDVIAPDVETPLGEGTWAVIDLGALGRSYYYPQYRLCYIVDYPDYSEKTDKKIIIYDDRSYVILAEYDENGKLISETIGHYEAGFWNSVDNMIIDCRTLYKYDDSGKQIERIHKTIDNHTLWIESYKYDAEGKLIEKVRDSEYEDEDPVSFSYIYDENGNLLKEEYRGLNHNLRQVLFYDSDGNVVKDISKYSRYVDDTDYGMTEYEYQKADSKVIVKVNGYDEQDGENYKTEWTFKNGEKTYIRYNKVNGIISSYSVRFNANGEAIESVESGIYYDGNPYTESSKKSRQYSDGKLVKEVSSYESGRYKRMTISEKIGNTVSEETYYEYSSGDADYYKTIYSYDENGRLLGSTENSYRYIYEYDDHGKRVKETGYYIKDGEEKIDYERNYEYKYDEKGRVIMESRSYHSGNYEYSYKPEYYTYLEDEDGYSKRCPAPSKTESLKDKDGNVYADVETYGDDVYTYYYDSDGEIKKIVLERKDEEEIVFERECDADGNIILQPIKKNTLSDNYYSFNTICGNLYVLEVALVDSENRVHKRLVRNRERNLYEYEYANSDGLMLKTSYRNGYKEKDEYYDEKDQKVKMVVYDKEWYNGDYIDYTTSYSYLYDDSGTLIKRTVLSTYGKGYSEGYAYELDENGFLKAKLSYSISGNGVTKTNIPDDVLRKFLADNYDKDGDGFITPEETQGVTELDCSNMEIKDLKGINLLTELKTVDCRGNQLEIVDVSYNTDYDINVICDEGVVVLHAVPIDEEHFPDEGFRNLVSKWKIDSDENGYLQGEELCREEINLNIGKWEGGKYDSLTGISCFWNLKKIEGFDCSISDMNLSGCYNLETLDLEEGIVKSLNLEDCSKLKNLYLDDVWGLDGKVDLSNCTQLEYLDLSETYVKNLDLSNCTKLKYLELFENGFDSINLSNCTELTHLSLRYLDYDIADLLDLSNCTELKYLDLEGTDITSLDISKCEKLEELNIQGTSIMSIDLSNNPLITKLYVSDYCVVKR